MTRKLNHTLCSCPLVRHSILLLYFLFLLLPSQLLSLLPKLQAVSFRLTSSGRAHFGRGKVHRFARSCSSRGRIVEGRQGKRKELPSLPKLQAKNKQLTEQVRSTSVPREPRSVGHRRCQRVFLLLGETICRVLIKPRRNGKRAENTRKIGRAQKAH